MLTCSAETILPYAVHFVNLKNTDLVDPARKIIINAAGQAEGRRMILEDPQPVPSGFEADMTFDMLHVLSQDLLATSASKALDSISALYNLSEAEVFFEWVNASPLATFQLLILGVVKRISDKGIQVAERATALFLRLVGQEALQFRMQETDFTAEIKVIGPSLGSRLIRS